MLAELGSDKITLAIVFGIPVAVMLLVFVASSLRAATALRGLLGVVAVVVVVVSLWAVFHGRQAVVVAAPSPASIATSSPSPSPAPSGSPSPTGQPSPTATGPGPSPTASAACSPSGTTLSETAQNVAFQATCLAAPANTAFTINFDNKDSGIPHDIHIFSADPTQNPGATSLFMGALVTGPNSATYQVPSLPAGTYFFHCDVHPTQMTGTFVVK